MAARRSRRISSASQVRLLSTNWTLSSMNVYNLECYCRGGVHLRREVRVRAGPVGGENDEVEKELHVQWLPANESQEADQEAEHASCPHWGENCRQDSGH